MALLKLSGLVTKISGKLGGNILGTSNNGSYIKQNSYSQQHATPRQSLQRTQLYPVTQLWRDLSQDQRDLWIAETVNYPYVNKVGDTVEYTGYQLFVWINLNIIIFGFGTLSTPNPYIAPVTPTITFSQFNGAGWIISYTGNSTQNWFVLYVTKGRKNSLKPKESEFLYLTRYTVSFASGTISFRGIYLFKFGTPEIGDYVWVKIKPINGTSKAPATVTNISGNFRVT